MYLYLLYLYLRQLYHSSPQTTRDRLIADKAEFDIYGIKDGVSLYRNPVQTMEKIKDNILIHIVFDYTV